MKQIINFLQNVFLSLSECFSFAVLFVSITRFCGVIVLQTLSCFVILVSGLMELGFCEIFAACHSILQI